MNKAILTLNGEVVAASTSCSIDITQQAVPVTPLPGSADDDGWEHYRPGELGWDLRNDTFFCDDSIALLANAYDGIKMQADVILAEGVSLTGDVSASNISIQSAVKSLSKLQASFACDGFPELNITEQ